jgi:hypothetical protein
MAQKTKRYSVGKKLLIALLIFIVLLGIGFQIFITRYLPPIVRQRLENIIVKGSDSLYRFDVGNFDVSFWGRSVRFTDLRITIDSNRYAIMKEQNMLPGLSLNLHLKKGNIGGIGLWSLFVSKKINIERIYFDEADVHLARHFRDAKDKPKSGDPLWKLIQPDIKSINIEGVRFENVKMTYRNVDSAKSFRWQFDSCNVLIAGIRVDSASSMDTSRLLFAKNLSVTAMDVKLKTPDGLYNLLASSMFYSSASRSLEVKQFEFKQAVSNAQFIKHFGYQHEIYNLKMPTITISEFDLPQWIIANKIKANKIQLVNPDIQVHMDRNAKPNPYSKKGKYPQQLLQRAPFGIDIKQLTASNAKVTYSEKSDATQLTGKLLFSGLRGQIDNITNYPSVMDVAGNNCVIDVKGGVMKTGSIHAIFRLNLRDLNGSFSVNATISNLDAPQLQPLAKAMTATDLQTFDLHRLDYQMSGNEISGKGNLKMKYSNMDILLNKVENDQSFNKRGFLSFLANRLVIYKENPIKDDPERVAQNIPVQRDDKKSFFNFIWKTLYSAAGEIVLRPAVQRKMEKKKQRQLKASK